MKTGNRFAFLGAIAVALLVQTSTFAQGRPGYPQRPIPRPVPGRPYPPRPVPQPYPPRSICDRYYTTICENALVEVVGGVGSNVVRVLRVLNNGQTLVQNPNNGGQGLAYTSRLRRLPEGRALSGCLNFLCRGDVVFVDGPVGAGENVVRVLQVFTNNVVQVQGLRRGEVSMYLSYRLHKQRYR